MLISNDHQTPCQKKGQASLDRWNEAVGSANQAWELLSPTEGTAEELDNKSKEGMKYLAHSCVCPSKSLHCDPDFCLSRVEVIPRLSETPIDLVSDDEINANSVHAVNTFFENGCTIWAAIEGQGQLHNGQF